MKHANSSPTSDKRRITIMIDDAGLQADKARAGGRGCDFL